MTHFRCRQDLINYVIKHCKRRSLVRAFETGHVEFLGAFNPIGPMRKPGWMFQVTSVYGRLWNVAILATKQQQIIHLEKMPWNSWIGRKYPDKPLFLGDYPEKCRQNME